MKFDLILSTSKRLSLFKETIDSFFKLNTDANFWINKVFILDDRSSWKDRKEMFKYLSSYIIGTPIIICFDSQVEFEWVDKFNFIGKVVESDYVFFLEDDWRCVEPINFQEILQELKSSNLTQIALCDPLWIQNSNIINENQNSNYWDNPYPKEFKHITHKINDGLWGWSIVTMNHYTNNPSITKSIVFKENKFPKDKNFEVMFAENQIITPKQKFSKKLHFEHIGFKNSLINKL